MVNNFSNFFQKKESKKIVFVISGGTGGHIIPARCLAEKLSENLAKNSQKNFQVIFFGDKKYFNYIKKSDQFSSKIISSSQIEKKPAKLMIATVKILAGIFQSIFFILYYRPNYIIAFGGYSTFPMLIAATLTKKISKFKIFLHEQNAYLGKVNRIFAKYADNIAVSFQQTEGIKTEFLNKIIFTGNPIRSEIKALNQFEYNLPKNEVILPNFKDRLGYNVILASDFNEKVKINKELFNILIIGGSGGAKIFSEILPKVFFNFPEDIKNKIKIIQQCRSELVKTTFDQYHNFNISVEVRSFFDDMAEKINKAHLIISRSGSSSIFEFCVAKKPMILIPFAASADDHQQKNADFLEKKSAAIVIKEQDFTINNVGKIILNLMKNPNQLIDMSINADNTKTINADENLAKLFI